MMCSYEKSRDGGVSPVVGVMLMLVVTIIIAAVVSAMAGGLATTKQKAPSGTFEVHISNDGTWGGSGFHISVQSVSEPIPTKDLKLVTSWVTVNGTRGGVTIMGPNTTTPGNTHYGTYTYHSPLGFGPGVEKWRGSGNYYPEQHYGNYSIMAGTAMHNIAAGYSSSTGGYGISPNARYVYSPGTYNLGPEEEGVDAMEAILGTNWQILRPGDKVNVKFIHIPTGSIIFDQDVPVEG